MTISFFLLDDELLDFFMGCERPRFYVSKILREAFYSPLFSVLLMYFLF
jgi:hypothetical protein